MGGSHPATNNTAAAPKVRSDPSPEALRGTPGPAGKIAQDAHVNPLSFLGGLIERYGDVSRYQTAFGPCFFFVHPKHVQTILHRENYSRTSLIKMMLGDGLLASDGPRWRSQRRLMQRDFLPAAVTGFVPSVVRETHRTATAWEAAARSDQTVDITQAMTRVTLRIVVDALFSEDFSDDRAGALCDAVTQTVTDLGRISWSIFGAPAKFTPDSHAKFIAARKVIDDICYGLIAHRRARAPADRPRDLLTMLVTESETEGSMDDRQLRDELVTMLVGGHETTALALAWTWKVLAEDPAVEAALHEEVDAQPVGNAADMTDISRLSWARAVFDETMRLYPPVWSISRVAQKDDIVDGRPIPRGACVLLSPWFTHRHPEFWPQPQRFDPSRFVGPDAGPPHRYAYFPFGGGRHQCLGMHFSVLEGTLILAQLARRFKVHPVNAEQVRPAAGITLRQTPGLLAKIEMRQPAPAAARTERA